MKNIICWLSLVDNALHNALPVSDLPPLEASVENILKCQVSEGGFIQRPGNEFRPDVTAWSVIALSGERLYNDINEKACRHLAQKQLPDGRVPIYDGCDEAYWPTPLAILAWKRTGGFKTDIDRAVKFLLETWGLNFPREKDSPLGHDSSIRGWSWDEKTHSWIEPTSMSILALKAVSFAGHDRVKEAVRMILNRQLPSGGWNYGNTTVFDRELLPMPEYTGLALCALSGFVQKTAVEKSIEYARQQLPNLRTPLSFCWCCFGLSTWSFSMKNVQERVLEILSLQNKYGPYDTTLLAQLVIEYKTNGDFLKMIMS
jgi:hypothetical protein